MAALEARSALNRPSSGKGGVQLAPMAPPKELQDMNKHLSNCVAALANLVGVQVRDCECPFLSPAMTVHVSMLNVLPDAEG